MSLENVGEKIFSTHCDLAGKASNTLPYIFILRTVSNFDQKNNPALICFKPETLEETIESGPLCITDLFQNKISL